MPLYIEFGATVGKWVGRSKRGELDLVWQLDLEASLPRVASKLNVHAYTHMQMNVQEAQEKLPTSMLTYSIVTDAKTSGLYSMAVS